MKFTPLCLLLPFLLFSCKKENLIHGEFSEAQYVITITGNWSVPSFAVPSGAHFTAFLGMVHNSDTYLWKVGVPASRGVERVAEIGDGVVMLAEIDSIITRRQASSVILLFPPSVTGTSTTAVYCNSNFSHISLASMLAPSPDWFVGLNSLDLYPGKKWITDTTIYLYAHDAGTEEGDIFGYNNPATNPQQNIFLLSATQATVLANGNQVLSPIATARITRR